MDLSFLEDFAIQFAIAIFFPNASAIFARFASCHAFWAGTPFQTLLLTRDRVRRYSPNVFACSIARVSAFLEHISIGAMSLAIRYFRSPIADRLLHVPAVLGVGVEGRTETVAHFSVAICDVRDASVVGRVEVSFVVTALEHIRFHLVASFLGDLLQFLLLLSNFLQISCGAVGVRDFGGARPRDEHGESKLVGCFPDDSVRPGEVVFRVVVVSPQQTEQLVLRGLSYEARRHVDSDLFSVPHERYVVGKINLNKLFCGLVNIKVVVDVRKFRLFSVDQKALLLVQADYDIAMTGADLLHTRYRLVLCPHAAFFVGDCDVEVSFFVGQIVIGAIALELVGFAILGLEMWVSEAPSEACK